MERWTDELMDGWTMERRKRIREILSIPLSLYSPQPSSLLNSQSRRGTAVPSTMCCGSSDAKPVLGQPLIVSRLVPAASVFNWVPQLHSCPFLSPHPEAVSLPHHLSPLLPSLLLPPQHSELGRRASMLLPFNSCLLWSHLVTRIPIPDTRSDRRCRQVTIRSSYKMTPPHMQGCMLTVGELEMGINTSSVPLYH